MLISQHKLISCLVEKLHSFRYIKQAAPHRHLIRLDCAMPKTLSLTWLPLYDYKLFCIADQLPKPPIPSQVIQPLNAKFTTTGLSTTNHSSCFVPRLFISRLDSSCRLFSNSCATVPEQPSKKLRYCHSTPEANAQGLVCALLSCTNISQQPGVRFNLIKKKILKLFVVLRRQVSRGSLHATH